VPQLRIRYVNRCHWEYQVNSNSDNRKRAFADVVTIDAWHETFLGEAAAVDLHVDVVFGTARVGGESQSPVRFRLSVKRAEIVLIIPDSEPVSVDRRSVSRDTPEIHGHLTEVVQQDTQAKVKGGISTTVSTAKVTGSVSAEANAETSRSESKKLEVSATVQFIAVTQSNNADGQYRWLVEPRIKGTLEGRPWDAIKQPRLKLIDQRRDRSKGIPPTVRVEVRCRREDLHITDIVIKDENLWEAAKRKAGFKNKIAAAASYIRDHLSKEGLEVKNIEDMFGTVTMGSVTAASI
jgi:hypothetical protein